jgi:hypothetical protein
MSSTIDALAAQAWDQLGESIEHALEDRRAFRTPGEVNRYPEALQGVLAGKPGWNLS